MYVFYFLDNAITSCSKVIFRTNAQDQRMMDAPPLRARGPQARPSSSRQNRYDTPKIVPKSPARHLDNQPSTPPEVAKRKPLTKSVTGFFNKLRPSRRPERGGTLRPTAEDTAERQIEIPTPPKQAGSCRRKRSVSLDRHPSDTIPPNRWNTAFTPPRRSHSAGAKGRKPLPINQNHAAPSTSKSRDPSSEKRMPPRPVPCQPSTSHLPNSHTTPSGLLLPSPNPSPKSHHPLPTETSHHTRDLFLAKRRLRQQRRSLIASGDFLGVTGVNPYTGEPDIITPPTTTNSSEDNNAAARGGGGITVTSTSSLSSPTASALAIAAAAAMARSAADGARGEANGRCDTAEVRGEYNAVKGTGKYDPARLGREERKIRREIKRLERAEKRKEAVREIQRGVRWRKEEGGWSSVAEPRLSPIPQSQSQSRSGSSSGRGVGDGRRAGGEVADSLAVGGQAVGNNAQGAKELVIPERRSFLTMAAAARSVEGRRRSEVQVRGEMEVVLVQRQQPGQSRLEGEAKGTGWNLCPWKKPATFTPPIPRRGVSLQQDVGRLLHDQPEWEMGNLVAIPVDLRRLSEYCRARKITTGRVLELGDVDPAHLSTDCRLTELRSLGSTKPVSSSKALIRIRPSTENQPQVPPPSAYTRTTTTTGCARGQPRCRVADRLYDATLDGSQDTHLALAPGPLTPTARSRSTSRRFLTTMFNKVSSEQLGSRDDKQLSV
ncbi:hypothetical protein VTI74DRAFT_4166 [Chaetomium olivicolor]